MGEHVTELETERKNYEHELQQLIEEINRLTMKQQTLSTQLIEQQTKEKVYNVYIY